MKHLLEFLKIVDGAINGDRATVVAYTEQLASKLEKDGDVKSAIRIRKITNGTKVQQLNLNRGNHLRSVPVDSESRLTLADEKFFESNDVKIFLTEQIQKTIDEFCTYVEAADHLISEGVGISPSLLLYGPPGCGKTELAHHISANLELPIITARSDTLISSYLGSTSKNIRSLFDHASSRPCVLFLDEFDSIAKLRDDKNELGELKRVVISILQNIDALESRTILIAATNHEHLLDPAIWRRFGFQIRIDKPNEGIRLKMFNEFLGDFSNKKLNKSFTAISVNLSGAQIKLACNNSKRHAIVNNNQIIDELHILKYLISVHEPSIFNTDIPINTRIKKCRSLNEKILTIRLLSKLFGISVGKTSNLLKHGN